MVTTVAVEITAAVVVAVVAAGVSGTTHLRQSIPPGPLYVLDTVGPQYRTFPKMPVWSGEHHSVHTPPLKFTTPERYEPPFQSPPARFAPLLHVGGLQSSGQSSEGDDAPAAVVVPVAVVVAAVVVAFVPEGVVVSVGVVPGVVPAGVVYARMWNTSTTTCMHIVVEYESIVD